MSLKRCAQLEEAVQAAVAAAARTGEPHWAALQLEVPRCDALAAFESSQASDRFYWERPAEGRSIAAFGCAAAVEPEGETRFAEASERAARVFERLHVFGAGAPDSAGPFLVGGFAFADSASTEAHWRNFPSARLVLPEVTLVVENARSWCTLIRCVASDDSVPKICDELRVGVAAFAAAMGDLGPIDVSTPRTREAAGPPDFRARADRTHAAYRDQVDAALREIARGGFEKVVLARSISISKAGDYDPCALLNALRQAHPTCATFAIARADAIFLGASPECLMRIVGRRLETASVAGSAPRGRNPDDDRELGQQLRESKKEQAEHAFVVRALCDALAPHCEALDVRESPRLLRLRDIQHLETPIVGNLRPRQSIFELLASVHPTPAVAGAPRDAALRWLNATEKLERGWYSGPVGFADAEGGGEFFAALRSAVLCGNEARLFAGAGVVEGSDPEAELRETRLKLRAMLGPLMEI